MMTNGSDMVLHDPVCVGNGKVWIHRDQILGGLEVTASTGVGGDMEGIAV